MRYPDLPLHRLIPLTNCFSNYYLRAIINLPAKELSDLPEVISLIFILVSTFLVTTPHTSIIVISPSKEAAKTGKTSTATQMVKELSRNILKDTKEEFMEEGGKKVKIFMELR